MNYLPEIGVALALVVLAAVALLIARATGRSRGAVPVVGLAVALAAGGLLYWASPWAFPGHGAGGEPSGALAARPDPAAPPPDCTDGFLEIPAGVEQCGLAFGNDRSLRYDGRVVADRVISSRSSDGSAKDADLLKVYPPSESGRYSVIKACEAVDGEPDQSLCWKVLIFDSQASTLTETNAGKYGPADWIRWSPDGRAAVLYSADEGAFWIHVIDPASGASIAFPPYQTASNGADRYTRYQITALKADSFEWDGPRAFRVVISYRVYDAAWKVVEEKDSVPTRFEIAADALLPTE